MELVRFLGVNVKGILTGNHGPELSYKHQGWHATTNVRRMKSFVEATASVLQAAGTRPVYGTIDWDLLHDVHSMQELAATIQKFGGWQICFTGFTLVPDTYMQSKVKHFQGEQLRELEKLGGPRRLREYLSKYEVWSGVGGAAGLDMNPPLLEAFGYKAGMVAL
jgi:hypothetical protein